MRCEDLQFDLPVYADNVLSEQRYAAISVHLEACPLCRQKVADYQELRVSMRALPRPCLNTPDLSHLRTLVADRVGLETSPIVQLAGSRRGWMDVWLMPYAVGTVTSLIAGMSLIWMIMSADLRHVPNTTRDARQTYDTAMLAFSDPSLGYLDLSPQEYARSRSMIATESPSINPRGALVALARSLVRGEMQDDEVVVVADVFGNGLARIADVVEPSSDIRAVSELRRALQSDPAFAPFVPAVMDHRSERVRVVLRIQNVNVNTGVK